MNLHSQTLAYFILYHLNSDPLSWGAGRCYLGGVRALSPSWALRLQGGIYGPGIWVSLPVHHNPTDSPDPARSGSVGALSLHSSQAAGNLLRRVPSNNHLSHLQPHGTHCAFPLSHPPWPSALLLLWASMKGQKNIGLLVAFAFNSARIPEASKS